MGRRPLRVDPWRAIFFEVRIDNLTSPFPSPTLAAAACLVLVLGLCSFSTVLAGDLRFERWRWSNPLPHGNNVMDMIVTSEFAIQVGDGGSVYVQGDDARWAPAVTGVTNYLRGVALMGSRFLVTGEDGCILWSDDGAVFQKAQLSPATTDWFEGVAASAQRAVAVGDNGAIYTSTNGFSWSKVAPSPTLQWLRGVAFGGGIFVAVGENGTVLKSSSSGNSWTVVSSGTSAHLNRVRYLGTASSGQFVAVGTAGTALSSATGAAPWVSLNSGSTNTLFDVATNDNGTLLVGDQELRFRPAGSLSWTNQIVDLPTNAPPAWTYYSAYGATNYWLVAGRAGLLVEGSRANGTGLQAWAPLPDSSHAWLWDVTVQRGICVAVGDLATIQTSLDGILWAREVVPGPRTNVVLLGVGGTTNLLLAAGNAGNLFFSTAGITNMVITNYVGTNIIVTNAQFDTLGLIWTNVPPFTTNSLQGIAASENLYVVCGERGSLFTSPNGTNWTARSTPTTNFLSSVAAAPGGWVAVGTRGTLLWAGPDASSWSSIHLGTTNWIYRVRYAGQQLVAVGQNGAIYTSANGATWTPRSSGTRQWLNDVTWLDGKWWVIGTQGLLLCSSNLVDWIALPSPTVKSLYAACAYEGKLLVAGIEGVILRNPVEPVFSPVNFLGYNLSKVSTGSETNVVENAYELFLLGGKADQFFEFQSATNLAGGAWSTNATVELFDASGTIYLLRTRNVTNLPLQEVYRTRLTP